MRVEERAYSLAVELHVPFGRGNASRFPNTKGISNVCVAPRNGNTGAGTVESQLQVEVWLYRYVYTGTPFLVAVWSAR
jgi:hypothetical protein